MHRWTWVWIAAVAWRRVLADPRCLKHLEGSLALALALLVSCSSQQLEAGRWVVLPMEQAASALKPCSRPGPRGVETSWDIPASVLDQLEADLEALTQIAAQGCCLLGARVRHPKAYLRQYVGVVINGRPLIYINAFRSVDPTQRWLEEAIDVCDGGETYWGALYDPQTRRFSQLAFNGIA